MYEGSRFYEPDKDWKTGAWFLTVNGNDKLPDGTVVASAAPPETPIDLINYVTTCDPNCPEWYDQILCDYAQYLAAGEEVTDNFTTQGFPSWIMQALHPKTVGHQATANGILQVLTGMGVNYDI